MDSITINNIEFVRAVTPSDEPFGRMVWPATDDDGRPLYAIPGGRVGTESEIRRIILNNTACNKS